MQACDGDNDPAIGTASDDPAASNAHNDQRKQALLARAAQCATEGAAGLNAAQIQELLQRYYRHVPWEDLEQRPAADVMAAALSQWQWAAVREDGAALVRVFSPCLEEDGWASPHTVIETVVDDMPFLVDSLTAQLGGQDREVHLVIHPLLQVVRDEAGRLVGLQSDGEAAVPAQRVVTESWIHIEIDRESDPHQVQQLTQTLQQVLADVRQSRTDDQLMRQQALAVADGLQPHGSTQRQEAMDLARWLAQDNFVFLGYQQFSYLADLPDQPGDCLQPVPGSTLGVLRVGQGQAQQAAPQIRPVPHTETVVVTKAQARSTVHRATNLDYIGITTYDQQDTPSHEHVFVGLFAPMVYTERPERVPLIRRKVEQIMAASDFPPTSHSYRDLLNIVERFPRDELFQAPVSYLERVAHGVLTVQERRRVRVFARVDTDEGFVSVLAYLPRDRFNTGVRMRMQQILLQTYQGISVDSRVSLTDSVLARLHFLVHVPQATPIPHVDTAQVQQRINEASRAWSEDFADALDAQLGEEQAARLARAYPDAFGQAYQEMFDPRTAVGDLQRLSHLQEQGGLSMSLYTPAGAAQGVRRFKIISTTAMSLSQVLPVLQNLGVEVLDERPYQVRGREGVAGYLYDFGLHYVPTGEAIPTDGKTRFQEAFAAVWAGSAEDDGFNALVLRANLSWRQAAMVRAYGKYLRQIGMAYSQDYVEQALVTHWALTRLLVQIFTTRFDPAWDGSVAREQAVADLRTQLLAGLERVESLDHDKILRAFLDLIMGTVRTNYFQTDEQGQPKPYLSFKLASQELALLPQPRPWCEIWVYSPRVEGVHLRFGSVARGGLRWSDRREDFRTEVLGLVKAQMVKNAVIVPTGAKGGFVLKQMPTDATGTPCDREAVMAEAVASYETFIAGLLDVTDNLATPDPASPQASPQVVHPEAVVCYDADDSYLVVAADKGTATFSDYANAVALRYGFWLGDAFASGGSAGYDHKAMGITARGAWESVRRHFRELGRDTQTQDFTVVGIGDMSGDVFGNAMLLSPHIRLVAAFDHRSIFLDPDPDAAASFAQRRRLFELPRSSWADYDPSLISAGGGVYPRSAKSIEISPQVRSALGLSEQVQALAPTQLIQAILSAPVDLLFNGGVGTYVKASGETSLEVGDKSNDAVRVNGADLRCLVVGEGGNLGFTQRGRIEYAQVGAGGRGGGINTDAIDNSAGVDTSDHEVNLKVLLGGLVAEGELTTKHRNELLAAMQSDVAQLVLRDNYDQNVVLGVSRAQSARMLTMHRNMINHLESNGELDRQIEFLPSEVELEQRAARDEGLSCPELAVLLAYAKIAAKKALASSNLPEDPWFARVLRDYFPAEVAQRYPQRLETHRLRRDIVITGVVNDMINRAGSTFVYRATDETGAPAAEVARAYTVARYVFDLDSFWASIEALDGTIATSAQTTLYLEGRRMVDRCVRWLLQARTGSIDVGEQVARFREPIASLAGAIPTLLVGGEQQSLAGRCRQLEQMGIPPELALRAAGLMHSFALLDVVVISRDTGVDAQQIAPLYFALSERFGVDVLLTRITALPRITRWHLLARSALRYDLYAALASLTMVVAQAPAVGDGVTQMQHWASQNSETIQRVDTTLREVLAHDAPDLAVLSVAVRAIRTLLPLT